MNKYDLLLHLDENNPQVLNLALTNALNYYNALPGEEFQLCLVANGPAVQLFADDQTELKTRAMQLHSRGLRIKLCSNALTVFELTPEHCWSFVEIVPAGLVEIVELQRKGFVYIKP